jgi:hypothetical protein
VLCVDADADVEMGDGARREVDDGEGDDEAEWAVGRRWSAGRERENCGSDWERVGLRPLAAAPPGREGPVGVSLDSSCSSPVGSRKGLNSKKRVCTSKMATIHDLRSADVLNAKR